MFCSVVTAWGLFSCMCKKGTIWDHAPANMAFMQWDQQAAETPHVGNSLVLLSAVENCV